MRVESSPFSGAPDTKVLTVALALTDGPVEMVRFGPGVGVLATVGVRVAIGVGDAVCVSIGVAPFPEQPAGMATAITKRSMMAGVLRYLVIVLWGL